MTWLKLAPWAGYPIAVALFFLWLDGRENLAIHEEQCNADKLVAVADAEKVAREAAEAALADRIAQLAANAERAERARAEAETARLVAESRPAEIREVIVEVMPDEDCLSSPVPAAILDRLRQ